MSNTSLKKPSFEILPAVLACLGIFVLCSLGYWQLERLEWKLDLINKIGVQYESDLASLPDANDIDFNNIEFLRAQLSGRLLIDKTIEISPRTHEGDVGAHVITPLVLETGDILLVNRGWKSLETQTQKNENIQASFIGLIKPLPRPNMFTPENDPAVNAWHFIDMNVIARAKDLNKDALLPYIFIVEKRLGSAGETVESPLVRIPMPPELKNDHLYYAGFWFTMALALATVYILRFLRKPKSD